MVTAMSDRFGQRFIKQSDFIDYVKFLGIDEPFLAQTLEFAERFCIVTPAARVRFPDSVVRRWYQERYPAERVLEPIEPDGRQLTNANSLRNALEIDYMRRTELARTHPLDPVRRQHRRFVATEFTRENFEPWSSHRTPLFKRNGQEIGGNDGVRTYYHAWQAFQLAAFLRSGITILYDVGSEQNWNEPLDLGRADVRTRVSLRAERELRTLAENAHLFDAVAQFTDRAQRALQTAAENVNRSTGRLSMAATRNLRDREIANARDVFARAKLTPRRMIEFLRVQCGLWSDAAEQHPARVVEAYKQSIGATIDLLRLARPRNTLAFISKSLGTGRHRRSILDVIFPDWVSEQRLVVEGSLRSWIVPHLLQMPPAFAFGTADVASFCDWIEARGFLQFYWHFRRLTDVGRIDDDMGRSAVTLEVIGLASLIEHFSTRALADRVPPARREILRDTLPPKLIALLRPTHAAIAVDFERHARRTTERTLRQQLDRIRRMRSVGTHTPVLKALLRLVLIRNTSSHAGLAGFNRDEMQTLVESLLIAALVVWMAR